MASTPRVAPTNEVVETDGARTCASGWCALLGGTRAVLPLRKLRFIFIQKLDVLVRGRGYGEHGTTPSIFGHETRALPCHALNTSQASQIH